MQEIVLRLAEQLLLLAKSEISVALMQQRARLDGLALGDGAPRTHWSREVAAVVRRLLVVLVCVIMRRRMGMLGGTRRFRARACVAVVVM